MSAFQSCELSHHVSVTAMRSWPCDCTQTSSSSCLFPMRRALVYRYFRRVLEHTGFPGGVYEDPLQPCKPLRWLVSWLPLHEATTAPLSLLRLSCLIPPLCVMALVLPVFLPPPGFFSLKPSSPSLPACCQRFPCPFLTGRLHPSLAVYGC